MNQEVREGWGLERLVREINAAQSKDNDLFNDFELEDFL